MRNPFRPKVTAQDDAIRYERVPGVVPPWPKPVAAIRKEAFDAGFLESTPALAHLGSWLVQAVMGGKAIGYVWIVRAVGDEHGCYAEEAAVRSGSRNRGIGSDLMREAARWMVDLRYESICVTSVHDAQQERREAWFVALGFVETTGRTFCAHPEAIASSRAT